MFACLCLVSSHAEHPVEALLQLAGDFSPRYEMVRPYLVLVEIGGLGRLLGTPAEIGDAFCHLARERGMVVSVAIAATHTAARLLALHGAAEAFADPLDAGLLRIVPPGREAAALAPLPLALLAMLPDDRLSNDDVAYLRRRDDREPSSSASAEDPRARTSQSQALQSQALQAGSQSAKSPGVQSQPGAASPPGKTRGKRGRGGSQHYRLAPAPLPSPDASSSSAAAPSTVDEQREGILEVLRRWGLKTLGDFVRLPAVDLFERLGREGIAWQQIARGRDARPLVPTTMEEPFEATLALDWPIETLEPLSFILTRLFEPLCARLERRDRGAAVLQVTLQLVTRRRHTRRLELSAPMRDPKVLRTLVLLELESHPPDAGIDRVTITIDPTPGRIVQHSLLVRALPTPEQLSTLLARLTAVMGDGRVGAPALLDTYRPDAFEMQRFEVQERITPSARGTRRDRVHGMTPWQAQGGADAGADAGAGVRPALATSRRSPEAASPSDRPHLAGGERYALRRFRRVVPARVTVDRDRPVHVAPDGLPAGHVLQAAGPWRTSGEWWKNTPRLQPSTPAPAPPPHTPRLARSNRKPDSWDRDEWDVALDNGSLYRLYLDHRQARWFLEATLD